MAVLVDLCSEVDSLPATFSLFLDLIKLLTVF